MIARSRQSPASWECANKTGFASDLGWAKKWTLLEKGLFLKFYCGGVSHCKPKMAEMRVHPTIVGQMLPILASDTKSISEAWLKVGTTRLSGGHCETERKLAKTRYIDLVFSWDCAGFPYICVCWRIVVGNLLVVCMNNHTYKRVAKKIAGLANIEVLMESGHFPKSAVFAMLTQ